MGGEPAKEFLDGLRERRYFDTAIEYLEKLRTSPDCPADLKETIDYEIGSTHLASAKAAASLPARDQALTTAAAALKQFLSGHARHPLAPDANLSLANILVEQGKLQSFKAEQITKAGPDRDSLLAAARSKYDEAKAALEAAEKSYYETAKSVQDKLFDPTKEADKIDQRDEARRKLVECRLFLATVMYQAGKTYPADSKPYQEQLTAAAAKFHDLYEKYLQYDAQVISARLWEARVLGDLGKTDEAGKIFMEMLALPDDPAYRALKTEAYTAMVENGLRPAARNYGEALLRVAEWEKWAGDTEEASPEGLKLHLLGARAAMEYAKSLGTKDPQYRTQIAAARHHLDFLLRFPGDTRREARAMLADEALGQAAKKNEAPPATYAEAKERGDSAWDLMVGAMARLQDTKDAGDRSELNDQLTETRLDALRNYEAAEAMRTEQTPVDEVNRFRFRLTYLYFADQDMYRAAVLGEFLARHYSQNELARPAAEIAVKAYRNLLIDARGRGEDAAFETGRMTALAQHVVTMWKGAPEADEARMMLVDTAIDNGQTDRALEYLAAIPADSPRRAGVELRVGQSFWAAYVRAVNQDEGRRPPQAELDKMVQTARQMLESGIGRARQAADKGEPVDAALALSVLYLAQMLLDRGQPVDAVKWLDDPKIGPMTLVAAKAPVAEAGNFRRDTYMAALRAYVGNQQLDKADKVMEQLEALVAQAGDSDAGRRLTQIYVALGRQLEDLLARLRSEKNLETMAQVSKSFEAFLTHIAARQQGTNFGSLNWVAQTFFSLGAGLDRGMSETPAEAREYYRRAATTYLAILKRADKEPAFAPPDAVIGVKIRLAGCLRAMDQYDPAMKLLLSLIREHERRIDLQMEAARTYQDWGSQPGKSACYLSAIAGGSPENDRNLVWGWGGIAQRVASYDKYQEIFHEARFNLALCRMKLALTATGQDKVNVLRQAELDITRVHALYPEMGGPEWFAKYDALLKAIRKFLGEKDPKGLNG